MDALSQHQGTEGHPAGPSATSIEDAARRARPVEAVVCVPTFRRPDQLLATLQSLAAQETDHAFAIVVVENDAKGGEGAAVAERFLASRNAPGLCVAEPRQGNCYAINRAFQAALEAYPHAQYFLMIDDDEIASPRWLATMVGTAKQSGAAIVGGPVFPDLSATKRGHLQQHPAFHPAYDHSGPVPLIYGSGNCLIARAVFDALTFPFFDLRFNFLGGGDTDFFVRGQKAGWKFHWAADAHITETVPPVRTTVGWLMRRSLRIGAINYSIDRKHAAGERSRLRLAARNIAILSVAPFRSLRMAFTGHGIASLHPLGIALGRSLAAIGIEPHQYSFTK